MSSPGQPSRSSRMSSASSSDHSPGPMAPTATPIRASVMTYSHPSPGRKMKKPLPRWLITNATTITPITPAAPSGVSSPSTSARPAASSVTLASHACSRALRIPIDANHRPVPAILPPPHTWL